MRHPEACWEGFVETSRLGLYAARRGAGAPLLFLCGSSGDLRLKRTALQSELAHAFDLLTFDPRGLGRSERPDGDWTMADYADDAAALMEAVGWESAAVVGESFGGMTALELAIRHPGKVRRLCVAAAAPGGAGGRSHPVESFLDLAPRERAVAALGVQDARFADLFVADPVTAEPAIVARMAADDAFFSAPGNAAGYPRLLAARARHDVHDRLHRIAAPTVVMAGRHDRQAPWHFSEAMAATIPAARLWLFDGGHGFAFASGEPMRRLVHHWSEAAIAL